MHKVFLGGTCAETTWREELIRNIQIPYYNPVVEDWTPECQEKEEYAKAVACNVHLYVITKEMIGVFSIAEAIESACTQMKQTILHVIPDGFSAPQIKSLTAVVDMVNKHGGMGYVDSDLMRTARILNYCFKI